MIQQDMEELFEMNRVLLKKLLSIKMQLMKRSLIKEINTGTYCFDNQALFEALKNVSNENAQGEYYLPDVIEILKSKGEIVTAFQTTDFDETLVLMTELPYAQAEKIMRSTNQ